MKNLLDVPATVSLSTSLPGIVLPAEPLMDGSEAVAPEISRLTLREQAAAKIVKCINGCINQLHLKTVERMIEQFELKYDATLPLRRFLMCKSFELAHYPNNA